MNPNDAERFYPALVALGVFFKDPLTPERQLMYWKAMSPQCTIEEWEYACEQAIARETFHAVPLPAVLMAYSLEYRAEVRRRVIARYHLEQQQQHLLDDPSYDRDFAGTERERRAAAAAQQAQMRAMLEEKWGKLVAHEATAPQPYRKRSTADLDYRPSEDPAVLRARALALVAQLRQQEDPDAPLH